MGTHSLIIMRKKIKNENDNQYLVYAVLYQQFDGYLTGVGLQLMTFLKDIKMVNGFDPRSKEKLANGAGCLFAQIISEFKKEVGQAYLVSPNQYDLEEYNYYVDVQGDNMLITIETIYETIFQGSVNEAIEFINQQDD